MSRKKHVEQHYAQGDVQPPTAEQCIAQSLGTRGGNIVEVLFADGSQTLCMIPSKFNKTLWIRKGGLLVVDKPIADSAAGGAKVTSNVIAVLYDEHVKQLRKQGVHVPRFGATAAAADAAAQPPEASVGSDSSGSLSPVPANPNRQQRVPHYSDVSDSD